MYTRKIEKDQYGNSPLLAGLANTQSSSVGYGDRLLHISKTSANSGSSGTDFCNASVLQALVGSTVRQHRIGS
jgi:hypothetical protein